MARCLTARYYQDMNAQRILQQVSTGDRVQFEINGRPATYAGVVTARGQFSMTVKLDETEKFMGVRFESVDYVTVHKFSS